VACTALLFAGALGATASVTSNVASARDAAEPVRINDLQVTGTHNSYHVEPSPEALTLITQVAPSLADLAVTQSPLRDQLDAQAIRQVELDVFADPDGTRWRPLGTQGFKVMHLEQIDEGSNCEVFVACLRELRGWSEGHPRHLPVFVLVQPEDGITLPGPPNPLPFTTETLDALDAEIRSVMGPRGLITPDQVRGRHPTVEAAVLADGWPTLTAARGRFVFLLDQRREQYVVGAPNLEGRVMFPASTPGQPDAAFLQFQDPRSPDAAAIPDLVRAGYLVRTRADQPVTTPMSGDVTQRDAAFASGAHLVSTDYPVPGAAQRWGSDYVAQLPGGAVARCNPVRAHKRCSTRMLAEPRRPEPSKDPRPTVDRGPATSSAASTRAR
jgi:hypothetical protein